MENEQKNLDSSPMSIKDWFITILIASIPIVGFVMLLVWAFDKNTNVNKANWAKANLLWYVIGLGIAILIFIPIIFLAFRAY